MPIEPQEDPPINPGQPSEPPQESPPGSPRPEVPPPMQEPGHPPQPDELPGRTPDELPVRGPQGPTTPSPETDTGNIQLAACLAAPFRFIETERLQPPGCLATLRFEMIA